MHRSDPELYCDCNIVERPGFRVRREDCPVHNHATTAASRMRTAWLNDDRRSITELFEEFGATLAIRTGNEVLVLFRTIPTDGATTAGLRKIVRAIKAEGGTVDLRGEK